MIAVVSQAWTLDDSGHADAYLAEYHHFLTLHREQVGFRGRRLLRGVEDRCHFTNVRYFDRVLDYERLVDRPGYATHIEAMGRHLDLSRLPPKEYVELVVSDGPLADDAGRTDLP